MGHTGPLPENILRCIPPAERKPLGAAGMTAAEAVEKAKAGQEEKLQVELSQYLNLLSVEFIRPSMRKRSALPPGWPDFTFCYRGVPIVVECKTEVGRLSADQVAMRDKLQRNGWTYILALCLDDVRFVLRGISEGKPNFPQ